MLRMKWGIQKCPQNGENFSTPPPHPPTPRVLVSRTQLQTPPPPVPLPSIHVNPPPPLPHPHFKRPCPPLPPPVSLQLQPKCLLASLAHCHGTTLHCPLLGAPLFPGAGKEVVSSQKTSCVNLVDLAGSERVKRSGVEGKELKEVCQAPRCLVPVRSAEVGLVTCLTNHQGNTLGREKIIWSCIRESICDQRKHKIVGCGGQDMCNF